MLHKVKRGDTLSQIAVDYHTTVDKIMLANPHIKDRDFIREGDTISIPAFSDYVTGWWKRLLNLFKR